MNVKWREGEYDYCANLVALRGDDNVGRDPKNIASYLRLQAASAFADREYEISARLGTAATAISADARNDHVPDWMRAERAVPDSQFVE